ncbi:hypothetical protein MASR1M36_03050 [Candidatus Cloacimonadaceae bacterium]
MKIHECEIDGVPRFWEKLKALNEGHSRVPKQKSDPKRPIVSEKMKISISIGLAEFDHSMS